MSGPQLPRGGGFERGLRAPGDPKLPGLTEGQVRDIVRRMLAESAPRLPVGAVYISTTGVNPNTELGYGTWTQFAPERVLVGYSGAAPFDVGEANIGNATHDHEYSDLPQHGHTLTLLNSLHHHPVGISTSALAVAGNTSFQGSAHAVDENKDTGDAATGVSGSADDAGVASPVTDPADSLPAAVVVFFWKRTL